MREPGRPPRRGVVFVASLLLGLCGITAGITVLAVPSSESSLQFSSPFARARRLLDEGRLADAKNVYASELKRDPKSVEALRGLALCARDEGDDETALQYLQKLTSIDPKDRAGWRQLALTAKRLGRDMEAMSAAQTALSLSPDGDTAMTNLLTRLLSSKDSIASGMLEDHLNGLTPKGMGKSALPQDPMDRIPMPKLPEPPKGLPKAGRGEQP